MRSYVTTVIVAICLVILMFAARKVKADQPSQAWHNATILAESGGNDFAIGDIDLPFPAYGPYQIRQPYVNDYNSWHKTAYKAEDCLGNRELSAKICNSYMDHYATFRQLGRKPTNEDFSEIHIGGPTGSFKNGAIDKNGRRPKNPKKLAEAIRRQEKAEKYWLHSVKPKLK